jgi:hypothetical protein
MPIVPLAGDHIQGRRKGARKLSFSPFSSLAGVRVGVIVGLPDEHHLATAKGLAPPGP